MKNKEKTYFLLQTFPPQSYSLVTSLAFLMNGKMLPNYGVQSENLLMTWGKMDYIFLLDPLQRIYLSLTQGLYVLVN